VKFSCSVDYGSSGSSIFDAKGRIVANLSQFIEGQSIFSIWDDFRNPDQPKPKRDVDIAIVLDRSGSMSLTGFTGSAKIDEAKQAASLFVSLLRTGASHQFGLVSFSTTASSPPDFRLAPVNVPNKNTLIGPTPPGTSGIIGVLAAGGMTTIGGGLQTALELFPTPTPTTNSRAILLMTDGLENSDPMIKIVEPNLTNSVLNIIGFGTDASLDGPRLTKLARDHDGIYTRAGDGLNLKKFFALAFGNIFNFGTALDPFFFLPANVMSATQVSVNICGETMLTAIIGWDNPSADLLLSIVTPTGSTITASTPGILADSGSTWTHIRIPLPFVGEQDGVWQAKVSRPEGRREFPPPKPQLNFFLIVLVDSGPLFGPLSHTPVYTGDIINPRVFLRQPGVAHMSGTVVLEVDVPNDGTGNILTKRGLRVSTNQDGDQSDPRASTLISLEKEHGSELVKTTMHTFQLFDDGEHGDGGMESDGIFGNLLNDLTLQEGNYDFHAKATYGHDCVASRETRWSIYVHIGIDQDKTKVTTGLIDTLSDGKQKMELIFIPQDKYGNYLGPGRIDAFHVETRAGSNLDGAPTDNKDGSYTQVVIWDPNSEANPGLTIMQPGRQPIVLTSSKDTYVYSVKFVCGNQQEISCELPTVRPGIYATEINIHNYHESEVHITKHIFPVVFAGAPTGREPRFVEAKAKEDIVLPPKTATMDDCSRIGELLLGAPLSSPMSLMIGFLEIVSTKELNVTAVYTASGNLKSDSVSIDVQQVQGKIRKMI
jgi:hypothetical protein